MCFFRRRKKREEKKSQEQRKRQEQTTKNPVYHVSQNKKPGNESYKMWRVRLEKSDKTIKFFDTQQEAIKYTEGLIKNNDGSLVIHSLDGKIRSQNYEAKNSGSKKGGKKQIYHISQNKKPKQETYKMWRVRLEGSDKTIKFFDTQQEAIDYANTLAKNNNGSIVIHSLDGKIRKQKY